MIKKVKSPYVSLSVLKKSDGGYHTFKTASELLAEHGVKDVLPDDETPAEEGYFRLQVRRRFKKKANKILSAMPAKAYLAALEQLGLTVAGKPTAKALGLSVRQCQRMASDSILIPAIVERLLKVYLKHGIDDG